MLSPGSRKAICSPQRESPQLPWRQTLVSMRLSQDGAGSSFSRRAVMAWRGRDDSCQVLRTVLQGVAAPRLAWGSLEPLLWKGVQCVSKRPSAPAQWELKGIKTFCFYVFKQSSMKNSKFESGIWNYDHFMYSYYENLYWKGFLLCYKGSILLKEINEIFLTL